MSKSEVVGPAGLALPAENNGLGSDVARTGPVEPSNEISAAPAPRSGQIFTSMSDMLVRFNRAYTFGTGQELSDATRAILSRVAALEAENARLRDALNLLITDFGDYSASQRPCHAFDVARAALSEGRS